MSVRLAAAISCSLLAARGNRVDEDLDVSISNYSDRVSNLSQSNYSDNVSKREELHYWYDGGYPVEFYYSCIARNYVLTHFPDANLAVMDNAACFDWRWRANKYDGTPNVNLLDPLLEPLCSKGNATVAHEPGVTRMTDACARVEVSMDPEDRAVRTDLFQQVFHAIFEDDIGTAKSHHSPAVLVAMGPAVDPFWEGLRIGRAFNQLTPGLADLHLDLSDFVDNKLVDALRVDGRYNREVNFLHEVADTFGKLERSMPDAKKSTEAIGGDIVPATRRFLVDVNAHIFGDGTKASWKHSDMSQVLEEMRCREAVNAAMHAVMARNLSFVFKTTLASSKFKVDLLKLREAGYRVEGYFPLVPTRELLRRAFIREQKTGMRVTETWMMDTVARAQKRLLGLLWEARSTEVPPLFDGLTMITRYSPDGIIQAQDAGYVALQLDGRGHCLTRCGADHIFRAFDMPDVVGCAGLPLCSSD